MAGTRHRLLGIAATAAIAALTAFGEATANHFILPCDEACKAARWTVTGSLRFPRVYHTATLLHDGKVLIAGGSGNASTELYDPVTRTWGLTGSMSVPRSGHTATLLSNGRVLVAGGTGGMPETAEIFDPVAQAWTPTGPMGTKRWAHTAVRLHDGRVLVAGGYGDGLVRTTELYDPDTNAWSPTGDLVIARYGHTMMLLDDGQVLLVGGSEDDDLWRTLSSTEIYDPRSGEWRREADTPGHGYEQPAARLPDGSVLLTGGTPEYIVAGGETVYAMVQRFDPDTESWIVTAGLLTPRLDHTATTLASGHVLIAGGARYIGSSTGAGLRYVPLAATERFDPATATWHPAASLNFARTLHTATRLADGTVLVAGGYGVFVPELGEESVALATAELYGAPIASRRVVGPDAARGSRRTP